MIAHSLTAAVLLVSSLLPFTAAATGFTPGCTLTHARMRARATRQRW